MVTHSANWLKNSQQIASEPYFMLRVQVRSRSEVHLKFFALSRFMIWLGFIWSFRKTSYLAIFYDIWEFRSIWESKSLEASLILLLQVVEVKGNIHQCLSYARDSFATDVPKQGHFCTVSNSIRAVLFFP